MKTMLRAGAMLAMALGALSFAAAGQAPSGGAQSSPVQTSPVQGFDLATNFTYKIAKISETTTRVVLPGGSVDAAYTFGGSFRGLGVVIDFNGEAASNVEPGVNLTQISALGGLRYSFLVAKRSPRPVTLYGEVLGGRVSARDSLFPGPSGTTTTAGSLAFQAGGGANIRLTHSISLRMLEADFITTHLPNAANSRQYDVRFSNGVVFHF